MWPRRWTGSDRDQPADPKAAAHLGGPAHLRAGRRARGAGFEPGQPGFFWLVGQGGAGIQTSPALARSAASLVLGRPLPADLAGCGVSAQALSPARLR